MKKEEPVVYKTMLERNHHLDTVFFICHTNIRSLANVLTLAYCVVF